MHPSDQFMTKMEIYVWGHILNLKSLGEAHMADLTNSESKVTTGDGLNVKIPK